MSETSPPTQWVHYRDMPVGELLDLLNELGLDTSGVIKKWEKKYDYVGPSINPNTGEVTICEGSASKPWMHEYTLPFKKKNSK